MQDNVLNISGYKFQPLNVAELPAWKIELKARAIDLQLKGTILLSHEGVNVFLSGFPQAIEVFLTFLKKYKIFDDIVFQKTWSQQQPFRRLLVKIKKEIISMGKKEITPEKQPAPYLNPMKFKQWLDENKELIILDTRNHYEVAEGTFNQAVDLNLKHFRHFPEAAKQLPEHLKEKTVVTFCTGGIRCEKAALYLMQLGFKEVYQLEGGVINYFNQCGNQHFQGACFVFDERDQIKPEGKIK